MLSFSLFMFAGMIIPFESEFEVVSFTANYKQGKIVSYETVQNVGTGQRIYLWERDGVIWAQARWVSKLYLHSPLLDQRNWSFSRFSDVVPQGQ